MTSKLVVMLAILGFAVSFCGAAPTVYPLSITVVSAKMDGDGTVTIHHRKPPVCNNPQPGFQAGFCATYNPHDTITESTTLIVLATAGAKLYNLACDKCSMIELGIYSARRSGRDLIVRCQKIDRRGNETPRWHEIKMRVVGEEMYDPATAISNPQEKY